jgi:hypothetical protein
VQVGEVVASGQRFVGLKVAVVRSPNKVLLMLIRASAQMLFHICMFLIFAIYFSLLMIRLKGQKSYFLSRRILSVVSLTKKPPQRDDVSKARRRSGRAVTEKPSAQPPPFIIYKRFWSLTNPNYFPNLA